jgi:NCAIR mutase (PurE)-related protein
MTDPELQDLLQRLQQGDLEPAAAAETILAAMRAAPFVDLGFARVDTHREVRQGFPEVILGLGKTPPQIAAIADKIVARGQTLLVTRATRDAYDAVRVAVPGAEYHPDARAITYAQGRVEAGQGTIAIMCAGTSDLPVAEEAAVTAVVMGNRIDRLYDVGVA